MGIPTRAKISAIYIGIQMGFQYSHHCHHQKYHYHRCQNTNRSWDMRLHGKTQVKTNLKTNIKTNTKTNLKTNLKTRAKTLTGSPNQTNSWMICSNASVLSRQSMRTGFRSGVGVEGRHSLGKSCLR